MKLRYLRARNFLSFGDEDVKLDFGSFNVIAGPNDSGKTNLFRALSLIEKAFDFWSPPLGEIIFQGDSDRLLHLEVGVELDDTELELLATLIICLNMQSVQRPEDITQGIMENKVWKNVLVNYGYAVVSKTLRHLSLVLTRDAITLKPEMALEMADEAGRIFLKRGDYLSETREDKSFQRVSLARLILDDFNARFKELKKAEIDKLLQSKEKLEKESPSLVALLSGKLEGNPTRMVELRGENLSQLRSALRGEPLIAKLSRLCQQRKVEQENLSPWNVLHKMYRTSFIRLQELRISPPSLDSSRTGQNPREATILGSDLALKLFWLMNSETRRDREKYSAIQNELKKLTGSEFDIAVRTETAAEVFEGEPERTLQHEAYVQIITDDYPIPIEKTASGLYEILYLLTTVIGESGKVLLLDEPELHLHPAMQKRILDLLSESMRQNRNQILLITHSPYLVSSADMDSTWRFTRTKIGTKVHNLGGVLSELGIEEQEKLAMKFSRPDVRSLLFSRGVILVEGLSDKIVVEEISRFLSAKNEGPRLDETEWSVVNIGGKKSLPSFMNLSHMLGVPSIAILDYDSMMHREHTIRLDNREVKTSSIVFALWRTGRLGSWKSHKALSSELPESEWYEDSLLQDLRALGLKHDIFVFSADLEGAIQSPRTSKKKKPLRALERILKLISEDSIPSEFYEMCEFLRKRTLPASN